MAVGDLLVTPVTGAYGVSMASNYNKVPRPAVVFVRDGAARVVVRRETYEDLVRLDAALPMDEVRNSGDWTRRKRTTMSSRTVHVGLLGCGHVGSALVRQITEHGAEIEARTGCGSR